MRKIGVLMGWHESDPEAKAFLLGFTQGLVELGWMHGRNVQIEVRWAADPDQIAPLAKALVDRQPDVILASTTSVTAAMHQATRAIPIVFAGPSDPVGAGFVASLPRPGGNLTGFINMEAGMGGKWLELLTELAPNVKRAAIMFNPETAPGGGTYFFPPFEVAARSFKIAPITATVHSEIEIEAAIAALGRDQQGGLVVMPDNFMTAHRASIIALAARNKVPAVYFLSVYARDRAGPGNLDRTIGGVSA